MSESAAYRRPDPAELCRLARMLSAALRRETDPDPPNLHAVDLVSSGRMSDRDHTACLALICAQRLHRLGLQRDSLDTEELYFVAGTLRFMLGRLDLNRSQPEVADAQNRLLEIAMDLEITMNHEEF
jgi:hypothetical protein